MSHAGTLLGLLDKRPCTFCGCPREHHESKTPGTPPGRAYWCQGTLDRVNGRLIGMPCPTNCGQYHPAT